MIVGLDLAASPHRPTGLCRYFFCTTVREDKEILAYLRGARLVVVDAPLSLEKPWRDGERELLSAGFRPLPLSLPTMEALARRAIYLREAARVPFIETFIQPMRMETVERLRRVMSWSRHERDAFLAMVTGLAFIRKRVKVFGKKNPIFVARKSFLERLVGSLLRTFSALAS